MLDSIATVSAPSKASRRARRALAGVVALVSLTTLSSCGLAGKKADAEVTPAPASVSQPAAVPAGLEDFYSQTLDWQDCELGPHDDAVKNAGLKCATIKVPLDYADPAGATIDLALKKRPAGGTSIGTLFINPGGPGGSGTELVATTKGYFSEELLEAYDVVGFDPRGVQRSTAVECLSDAEMDLQRSGELPEELKGTEADLPKDTPVDSPQNLAAVRKSMEWLAKRCEQATTQGLLDHIDTISAARDLDVMRAAVGSQALTYLGYSYGTYLGATYAELFPANVGRMVLDGALDPSLSGAEVTLGQAEGFEQALRTYIQDCQQGASCPLKGDVDAGVHQVQALLESVRTAPLKTSDPNRPLTESLASSAIIAVLYQSEAWSVLTQGLDQAMNQQDGSVLLYIADLLASRNEDGSYTGNGDEAITAINCLDYPVSGDESTWAQQARELEKASPTFGRYLAYTDAACQAWGHTSTRERTEIHARGAAPILVVGTTGDPATRYQWSVALAEQLSSGQLVTWEGEGHTAYGRPSSGPCVSEAVDTYLLSGKMPAEGLTCKGSE